MKKFNEHITYIGKFFASPLKLGSIAPTSKISGRFLAQHIKNDGIVLELGAGTGSLTQAILDSGIAPEKLICVEIDEKFCKILRKKFPQLQILCGDASKLDQVLNSDIIQNISTVVSAIPFLTLPKSLRFKIVENVFKVLSASGRFIQVSYSPFSPVPWKQFNLKQKRYGTIFKNLPPISIFGYER